MDYVPPQLTDDEADEMYRFMEENPAFIFDGYDHNWSLMWEATKQLRLPITAEALAVVFAGLLYSGAPILYDKTKQVPAR